MPNIIFNEVLGSKPLWQSKTGLCYIYIFIEVKTVHKLETMHNIIDPFRWPLFLM